MGRVIEVSLLPFPLPLPSPSPTPTTHFNSKLNMAAGRSRACDVNSVRKLLKPPPPPSRLYNVLIISPHWQLTGGQFSRVAHLYSDSDD